MGRRLRKLSFEVLQLLKTIRESTVVRKKSGAFKCCGRRLRKRVMEFILRKKLAQLESNGEIHITTFGVDSLYYRGNVPDEVIMEHVADTYFSGGKRERIGNDERHKIEAGSCILCLRPKESIKNRNNGCEHRPHKFKLNAEGVCAGCLQPRDFCRGRGGRLGS